MILVAFVWLVTSQACDLSTPCDLKCGNAVAYFTECKFVHLAVREQGFYESTNKIIDYKLEHEALFEMDSGKGAELLVLADHEGSVRMPRCLRPVHVGRRPGERRMSLEETYLRESR